uniref:Polyprotein n=1 Tax=Picornavirales sp. TaxID=1955153 RepID=A0A6M9Z793_9VIRU|nr:MAG: hypothetical protein 1 [Picornavirales sp.]
MFNGHSLAYPPGWGDFAAHYDPKSIIEYWQKNPPLFSSDTEYLTFGEYVTMRLLDTTSMLPVSHAFLVTALENVHHADNVLYKASHRHMNVRWSHIFITSSYLSHTFEEKCISGIEAYNRLVAKLSTLPSETRYYLTNVCEMYYAGPLENLAAQVDMRNIRYVVQKFKFANTVPLLMQLFGSPTWKGKLTAVIRLLELFDIDAFQATSEALHMISEFVLRVVSWIMDKTRMGVDFVKYQCGWKPASDQPETLQQQSAPVNVCTCGKPYARGCSLCVTHWCDKCAPCECPNRYHHIIGACKCSNNMDCLYRALAKELSLDVVTVKRNMFDCLLDPVISQLYVKCIDHYSLHDLDIGFGDLAEGVRDSLHVNNMAEFDALWIAGFHYKKNIQIRTETEVRHFVYSTTADWIYVNFVQNPIGHYEADFHEVLVPTHWIWGTAFTLPSHAPGFLTPQEIRKIRMSPSSSPSMSIPSTPISETSDSSSSMDSFPDFHEKVRVDMNTVADILSELDNEPSSNEALSQYILKMQKVKDDLSLRDKSEEESVEWVKKEKPDAEPSFFEALQQWNFGAITDHLKEWIKNMSRDCIQFFEDSPFVAGLLSIIAGVAQFLGLYMVMPTTKQGIAALVEKFQNATRTMHYARNGFKGVLESLKDCFACCKTMLGISNNSDLAKFKEQVAEALEVCRSMLIVAQSSPGTFVNDSQKYLEFRKRYLDMSSMYSRLIKFTDAKELAILNPVWFALTKTFESLTHIYTKFVNGMNSRIVPVCLYLYGATDIGKSSVLTHFTNLVNQKMGTSMSSYTISKGNVHWNNFAGQQIIRIDDMNQVVTPAEGDIDSLHLFNLVTDAPFIPMQAAIPDKGVMAAPYFVIVGANFPSLPSNTMIGDVQAWERRRHFCVNVSWPEHEKCLGKPCDHMKDKTKTNFDHLTFRIVPSVMSKQKVASTRVTNVKTGASFRPKIVETDEIDPIEEGEVVTLDELVERCIELHKQHKAAHSAAFQAAVEAGTMKLQSEHWQQNPIIALEGPPGTGKSTIFQMVQERIKDKCRYIRTLDEFKLFVKDHFVSPNHSHIIIDDLSTIVVDDDSWKAFSQMVHQMYNSVKNNPYLLICGVNRGVLEEKLGYDTSDQILRRMEKISSGFKKKSFGNQFLSKLKKESIYHTSREVSEAMRKEGQLIEEFVEYRASGNLLTQEGVAARIAAYEPLITTVVRQDGLAVRTRVDATCLVRLKHTSGEMANFINKSDFTRMMQFVLGAELKSFGKSNLTKAKFAQSMATLAAKCKGLTGVHYDSFEELLLQSRNNNLLESLRGECALLVLNDVIFYVDYLSECEVGMLDCGLDELDIAIRDLKEVTSFTTSDRLASLVTTIFPPWFTLSLDIFTTVLAIVTPTISAMMSCQDLTDLYAAYNAYAPTFSMVEEGTNRIFDSTKSKIATKLGVPELVATERPKFVPGMSHIKSPQTFFADDLEKSVYGDAQETKSYPDKHEQPRWKKETKSYPDKKAEPVWKREGEPKADGTPELWRDRIARNQEEPLSEYCDRDFKDVTLTMPKLETQESITLHTSAPESQQREMFQEVTADPTLYPIVNHLIKNCCEILDQHGSPKCTGLFIKSNVIRTVLHLENSTDVDRLFVRTLEGKVYPTKVLMKEPILDRLDLVVEDKTFEAKTDITCHLPNRTSQIPEGAQAILVTLRNGLLKSGPSFIIRSYAVMEMCYKTWKNLPGQYVIDYRGHKAGHILKGNVYTTFGDCGSLLILTDPHFNSGKLIGMHVGATETRGYASPLYRDQYKDIAQETLRQETLISHARIPTKYFPHPSVHEGGLATSDIPIYVPSKTKLYKNWYPLGPKCYEPAVLDGRDTRSTTKSVLYDEALKWCEPKAEISEEDKKLLTRCMTDIANHFADVLETEGKQLGVLTSTQAINKWQGSSHSEPINIHSSAGFPYNQMTKDRGKGKFITVDDQGIRHFNKANKKEVDHLQTEINKYMNPDLMQESGKMTIFQVFLKDECVKLKKIYDVTRTRTIAAAPLDFQIAFRRMFHTAHCAMMDCHRLLPIKIGINPLSLDWHDLFLSLAGTSMQAVDLDYKGWDFSANPFFVELLCLFYDILFSRLDPNYCLEHKKIREGLYAEIAEFIILLGRTLFKTKGGIPSGYPGTAPDNSLINLLLAYFAWMKIAMKVNPQLANWASFIRFVAFAIYGDDIIMAVHGEAIKDFNGLTIPEIVATLGFNAQPADKGDTFVAHRPLKDCIFLSRHFKFSSGIWVGPLQKDHLFKPSWYVSDRRSHFFWQTPEQYCSSPDIVTAAYESMLYESALHDDETFQLVYDAAMKVYRETHIRMPIRRQDALSRIYGDNIMYKDVHGLSFHDVFRLFCDYQHPCRPPKFRKFTNRISYSYGKDYVYPGSEVRANPLPKKMRQLLERVNAYFGKEWNSVLVNEYPPGGSIPWHKDDEPELDKSHGVLGLTLVGDGVVRFRRQGHVVPFLLSPGAAYLMDEHCLTSYDHARDTHNRFTISYTFRKID